MDDLEINSCTQYSPVFFQTIETQIAPVPLQKTPFISQISDQMISLADPDKKIKGVKLYVKSAAAFTLGVVPFTISKLGQALMQGCAFLAQTVEGALHRLGCIGDLLGKGVRMLLGIPAAISGMLLFGSAWVFSLTQKLVWGTYLVKHPQQEKVNTKLARFGATGHLSGDFYQLIRAFYSSSKNPSRPNLSDVRHFSIP
jgi:hypothetical protein